MKKMDSEMSFELEFSKLVSTILNTLFAYRTSVDICEDMYGKRPEITLLKHDILLISNELNRTIASNDIKQRSEKLKIIFEEFARSSSRFTKVISNNGKEENLSGQLEHAKEENQKMLKQLNDFNAMYA